MKVEILIISFRRDLVWIEYCLQSIQKFGSGFSGVTICVPDVDETMFKMLQPYYGFTLRIFKERLPPLGMLHHEVMICRADELCPDADIIFHVDSDCFFIEAFSPADYVQDGKPVLLFQDYSTLPPVPWKAVVDQNLKVDWPYESMRRLPLLHHRGVYKALRDQIEGLHGKPFDDYVFSCKPDFPEGFCEFNCLGTIAMMRKEFPYHMVDTGKYGHPKNKLLQFWSRVTPDVEIDMWYEGQQQRVVPIQIIESVLST